MKFKFLGTGQLATKRRCTSFIVNDSILFDIGNGTVAGLIENGLDVSNIKVIVISHFHADHFGDIVYFFHRRSIQGLTDKQLMIIGPKGLKQKAIGLEVQMFGDFGDFKDIEERWNLKFAELDDDQKVIAEDFEITAFRVKHGTGTCNGYIIKQRDGATLGYTGDACLSDGLVGRIPEAKNWIMDANDVMRMENFHIGFGEVIGIADTHKNTTFYAVHRKDYDTGNAPANLICPIDNDEYVARTK